MRYYLSLFFVLGLSTACNPPLNNPVVDSQLQGQGQIGTNTALQTGGNTGIGTQTGTYGTISGTYTGTQTATGNSGITDTGTNSTTDTGNDPGVLVGSWQLPCASVSAGSNQYVSETDTYNADGTFTFTTSYYSDAKCQTAVFTGATSGVYSVGPAGGAAGGATEINETSTKSLTTPLTAALASSLTSSYAGAPTAVCKTFTFSAGKTTDTTACDIPTPTVFYSIFLVSGNQLQIGESSSGCCSSPTARSATLSSLKATKVQ